MYAMNTSAILFDLDDTLMPEMSSEREAFLATYASAQERFEVDPEALDRAVSARAEELWRSCEAHRFCDGIGMAWWEGLWATFAGEDSHFALLRAWAPGYRHGTWARALGDVGIDDRALADELSDRYRQERGKRHVPFDDAAGVLESLREDFALGLLTNGAPDVQRTKLRGSGLGHYFREVLVTGDIGIGKPDPRPFEVILARLGVKASDAVMVGNSLSSDVQGAINAGVRSVWLNLDGSWAEEGIRPDVEIGSLDEIRAVLD